MQAIKHSLSFQSSDQIYDYNYALRSWCSAQSVINHVGTLRNAHYIIFGSSLLIQNQAQL